MDKAQMIVVDVDNVKVREIVYTYMGPKKPNGEALYDIGFTLSLEHDTLEVLPNGDHQIRYAKDGMVITVRPTWLYQTHVIRSPKKTVMGNPESQKPTVVN